MRVLGHPVHVMLVHFPVALWPAHWLFHVFAGHLPPGLAAVAGFWLLAGACAVGWAGAFAGLADLVALSRERDHARFRLGLIHAGINGTALLAFSTLAVIEYAAYPKIAHGGVWLGLEALCLAAMFLGNYFGGAIVWRHAPEPPTSPAA